MEEWINGRMKGWMDCGINGRMKGWINGRVKGWMDGLINGRME